MHSRSLLAALKKIHKFTDCCQAGENLEGSIFVLYSYGALYNAYDILVYMSDPTAALEVGR